MNYIKKDQVTNITFYQVPKVLFTEKYKNMTNNARIIYAFLRDRIDLSLKNNWCDANNNVYIIYTRESIANDSKISLRTVKTIMQELTSLDLIQEKRQGLNKPNIIYVCVPEDIEHGCKKCTSDGEKNALGKVKKLHSNDTELNQTELNETNFLHILSEYVFTNLIQTFIDKYLEVRKNYITREHKKVSDRNISYIEDTISKLIEEDIDINRFEEVAEEYFQKLKKKNDGDIVCFLKASQMRLFNLNYSDVVQQG